MIKVIAKITVKDGMVEQFKSNVTELIAETRKEAGCISYQLFQDINNSNVLTFVEEWESMEALQQHMKAKHFLDIVPKLSELQEKETEVTINSLVM